MGDKKSDSPSVPKKKITVRRSKSESKSKSKSNDTPTPPFSRNTTVRNLFSNFSSNRKKSPKETLKKENEAGSSTQTDINTFTLPTSTSSTTNGFDVPTNDVNTLINRDADEYFMGHKKRGKAIILNHENFDKEELTRTGTQQDVDELVEVLSKLKFEVDVHKDLGYPDIINLLRELSAADYTDSDCIMFFILTHGNKRREIAAKDVYYSVERLWEKFTADNCATLAGKPKLFFVNACRGQKKDTGFRLFRGRTETDSPQKMQSYKIPNHADFLIAYSTVDGFVSYRHTNDGSWFIQCFCKVLNEHYETKDLLKMLTITSRKVALDYNTVPGENDDCELKQVPSITSMLLRDVYFRP